MKKEYKKVCELIALENEEVLSKFEMVELKGGNDISPNSTNFSCSNKNCDCQNDPCNIYPGANCQPPLLNYCSIFDCSGD